MMGKSKSGLEDFCQIWWIFILIRFECISYGGFGFELSKRDFKSANPHLPKFHLQLIPTNLSFDESPPKFQIWICGFGYGFNDLFKGQISIWI